MTKKELAQSICNLVGESNIRTIANCYTRVRLTVKDPGNIKREELKKLEGVLGVGLNQPWTFQGWLYVSTDFWIRTLL